MRVMYAFMEIAVFHRPVGDDYFGRRMYTVVVVNIPKFKFSR